VPQLTRRRVLEEEVPRQEEEDAEVEFRDAEGSFQEGQEDEDSDPEVVFRDPQLPAAIMANMNQADLVQAITAAVTAAMAAALPAAQAAGGPPLAHPAGGRERGFMKITKFGSAQPKEWLNWRKSFELAADINEWGQDRSRKELLANLESTAMDLVRDVTWNQFPTLQATLEHLESVFLPPQSSDLARQEFALANQQEEETVQQWHARLRTLFRRAFPLEDIPTSAVLRDRFNKGLLSEAISMESYKRGQLVGATYDQVGQAAANQAAAELFQTDARAARVSLNAMKISGGRGGTGRGKDGKFQKKKFSGDCFYCGKPGHMAHECLKKQRDIAAGAEIPEAGRGGRGGARGGRGGRSRGRGGRGGRGGFSRGIHGLEGTGVEDEEEDQESAEADEEQGN
jgi:hypothetical protein